MHKTHKSIGQWMDAVRASRAATQYQLSVLRTGIRLDDNRIAVMAAKHLHPRYLDLWESRLVASLILRNPERFEAKDLERLFRLFGSADVPSLFASLARDIPREGIPQFNGFHRIMNSRHGILGAAMLGSESKMARLVASQAINSAMGHSGHCDQVNFELSA